LALAGASMKLFFIQRTRRIQTRRGNANCAALTRSLSLSLTLVFLLFLATPASAAWYNSSWLYRKAITIDHNQVPSNQTNFPVLVSLPADSDLASKALSDANDILFTSSDGTTKLSHEIEKYTSSTGELVAWVKIPTLSSSTDTTIYLYYGNASASNQQDAENVWDSNYVMVQHLNESPANTVAGHYDSTSHNNTGTPYNFNGTSTSTTSGTGKVDGADVFDGTDDYVDAGNDSSLAVTDAITIEAWVNLNEISTTSWQAFVVKDDISSARSYNLQQSSAAPNNGIHG